MSPACQPRDEYLDGALSAEKAQAFERHAKDCAECTRALASWDGAKLKLSSWAKTFDRAPTSKEVADLLERADAPRPSWIPRAAGIAAFAAAAVVAFLLLRPAAPRPFELSDTVARVELAGDKVAVAPHSRAFVRELGPGQTRVRLEVGSVVSHVKKRAPGGYFIVEAGDTEVRVVGTLFQVERPSSGPLAVEVKEGRVEVWRQEQKLATLSAGDAWSDTEPVHPLSDAAMRAMLMTLGEPLPAVEPPAAAPVDAGAPLAAETEEAPVRPLRQTSVWTRGCNAGGVSAASAEREMLGYLKAVSGDSDTWWLLGACRERGGKQALAVEAYKKAIAVGNAASANIARLSLSDLYEKQRDFKAAQELMVTYLKQPPKAQANAAGASFRLGMLHFEAGETAEAKQLLQKFVQRYPRSPLVSRANAVLSQLP